MSTVAAIQMTSGHVVEDNLATAGRLLREAKERGAEVACLPENFSFMGLRDADKLEVAEADGDGPVQRFLGDTARELKLWILGGSTVIKGRDANRVTNTSLLIDADGRRVARYDKIHLFDVSIPGRNEQYLESRHVMPGDAIVLADTPAGRLGMSVCYDMRFPGMAGSARGFHRADRPRALGDAAARPRDRESLLRGGAGAKRHAHQWARDLWGYLNRRLLGTGADAPDQG
jgi:predicted amidohydrolase